MGRVLKHTLRDDAAYRLAGTRLSNHNCYNQNDSNTVFMSSPGSDS